MILKYLKLRTIRILRDKYLYMHSCVAVKLIWFGMQKWYRNQVEDFAKSNDLIKYYLFSQLAIMNNTRPFEERKIFLDWLEQEVIAGRK